MDCRTAAVLILMLLRLPLVLQAQQAPNTSQTTGSQPAPSGSQPPKFESKLEAGDEDDPEPARNLVNWNEYHGKLLTIKMGGGFLYDYAAYAQDAASKQQFALRGTPQLRDSRVWFKGKLVKIDRPVTYTMAVMYDGVTSAFLVRETGVMIGLPELSGSVFIGRTKEGFSLLKITPGYFPGTMERQPISDASIPILADGIKLLGYSPRHHMLWNAGVFGDRSL